MRDVILIVLVFGGAFVALLRPYYGLLLFIWLGLLNPQSYTWGVARTLPLSQVAALATMVGMMVSGELKKLPKQRELYLLVLLWCLFGVTTLGALEPTLAITKLGEVSKILLMAVLTMILINSRERLHSIVQIIGLSLGFHALRAGVFVITTGGQYNVYGPENSFLGTNNAIGLAIAMNVPVLLFLIKQETRAWLVWLMRGMLVLSYPAIICTYSRGAWLGLAAVSALIFVRSRRTFLFATAGGLVVIVLLAVSPSVIPQRLLSRYDDLVNYEDESSAQSRLWNWTFCGRVGLGNPLTGLGFDYYSPALYPIYYPEFVEHYGAGKVWSCHDVWLTVFSEHGIPGFVLWIALLLSCVSSLRRISGYSKAQPEMAWASDHADLLLKMLVPYVVAGTFFDAAYFDLLYYVIAMTIILKELAYAPIAQLLPAAIAGDRLGSTARGEEKVPLAT